tara:strand:- start:1475 stop:1726 length:252 start_codon:yes stop_codon:yes gene_type:complete
MIGLIGTDQTQLNDISARIHIALNSSHARYFATEYGDAIKHTSEDLYALILLEKEDYYTIIINTLTEGERTMIQPVTPDWFNS